MKKRAATKKQNPVLYAVICALLRPYLRLMYNYSAPAGGPALPDGPILVLGAHSSNLDFLFALPALRKKRFNIVVTSYFFNNRRLACLLRFFHCIEKEQFRADVPAIRDMRASVKNGASVLIYPEGEVNGTGRTEPPEPNITRLCRLMDVPVYAIRTHGSYLTRPKWGPVIRRGRVEAEILPVAETREALHALSDGALYGRIRDSLYVNDYDWQRNAKIPFAHRDAAKGLHNLLYICPRCGREFVMNTAGLEIFCESCGNRGRMDEFGFLHPAGPGDVIPQTVPEWADLERESIRRAFASSPGHRMESRAFLQFHEESNTVRSADVGFGKVSLDRTELVYDGTCNGDEVRLIYPLSSFVKLPFNMGRQFDVPNPVRYTSIRPENPREVEQFVLAVQVIKGMEEAQRSSH